MTVLKEHKSDVFNYGSRRGHENKRIMSLKKIILRKIETCLTSNFGKLTHYNHLPTPFSAHCLHYSKLLTL